MARIWLCNTGYITDSFQQLLINLNIMNIMLYLLFPIICAMGYSPRAQSKYGSMGYRMKLFVNNHTRQSNRPKNQSARVKTRAELVKAVRSTVCNARTCTKCVSVFNYVTKNQKLQNYCSKILSLRRCCPTNLLVRTGF